MTLDELRAEWAALSDQPIVVKSRVADAAIAELEVKLAVAEALAAERTEQRNVALSRLAAAEEERDAVREVLGTPISGVFTVENVASRMEEAENVGYQCGVQHQEALIESLKCCGNCARDPQVDDECDECAAFATHWIRERPTQKLEWRKT